MRTSFLWLPAVVLTLIAGPAAPSHAKAPWKIKVAKVVALTTRRLSPLPVPALKGQVDEPLVIETPEMPESAYVVDVRVVNASSSVRTLRWDVTRSPFLLLPNGRSVWPKAHMLHGLAQDALVTAGVLEVDVPPSRSYDLHPVFVLGRIPAGSKLAIEGVGKVSLPRP